MYNLPQPADKYGATETDFISYDNPIRFGIHSVEMLGKPFLYFKYEPFV